MKTATRLQNSTHFSFEVRGGSAYESTRPFKATSLRSGMQPTRILRLRSV